MIGVGLREFINFGKETTNGTAVVPTRSLRIVSHTLGLDQSELESDDLAEDYHSTDELHHGIAKVPGDVVVEAAYLGEELFYHDLLGTYTFTLNSPAAGQHSHKFWFRPDLAHDFIPGLTIEGMVSISGALKQVKWTGMHVARLVQQLNAGGFLGNTWTFIGRDETAVTAAAAAFPARNKVRSNQASLVQIGAAAAKVYGGTITWGLPRDEERNHYGQASIREAIKNGRPMCTFEGEMEWSNDAADEAFDLYELYRSRSTTTKPVLITHAGPTLGGGTYGHNTGLPQCRVMRATRPVQDRGIIKATITMRSSGVGANAPYIELVNNTGAQVTT